MNTESADVHTVKEGYPVWRPYKHPVNFTAKNDRDKETVVVLVNISFDALGNMGLKLRPEMRARFGGSVVNKGMELIVSKEAAKALRARKHIDEDGRATSWVR